VHLSFHGEETHQFLASAKLTEDLESGAAAPGMQVLACRRRGIAFEALPPADGLSHYRYLSRKPVPDVVVSRDLGAAPAFVEELAEHTRMLLFQRDLMSKFHVRPVKMKMLTGVAGAGKSYAILAFWKLFYDIMSEAAGVPVEALSPRVMELRAPTILNKYLGESDKQIERFFDEAEQLADVPFETPDGRKIQLPVLVIIEECDAIARTRGGGETDAIHDRIQTTLLQRFDPTSPRLRDKPIIFICTTNAPALCDPAFVRRAGGTIERFGRLARTACRQVLAKHVRGLPFKTHNGHRPEDLEREATAQITAWLFCPQSADQPLAEVTYVGTVAPVSKYRKDFLTPALIDRAVQQAAAEACRNARRGDSENAGLTVRDIASAIDQQVRSVVEQLTRENIANYVDLPDAVRVATVRRLERPAALSFDLMRVP
jgi:SpoVK/Ycf46/Vps4 family AAA+-type ATPase